MSITRSSIPGGFEYKLMMKLGSKDIEKGSLIFKTDGKVGTIYDFYVDQDIRGTGFIVDLTNQCIKDFEHITIYVALVDPSIARGMIRMYKFKPYHGAVPFSSDFSNTINLVRYPDKFVREQRSYNPHFLCRSYNPNFLDGGK